MPTDKQVVRQALRQRRRELVAARDRAADDAALARHGIALLAALATRRDGDIALYEALPHEPPTASLVTALQERGHRVLLPITLPDFDLDWFDAADPGRTPLGVSAVAEVRVAFVPGLAIDRDGVRLGQGGGCYDRALPRLAPDAPRVVLLHPGEVSDEPLPRDAHDVAMTHWLTADGTARAG